MIIFASHRSPFSLHQGLGLAVLHFATDTKNAVLVFVAGGGFLPDPVEFSSFSLEANGNVFDAGNLAADGPILTSRGEIEAEEGFALR